MKHSSDCMGNYDFEHIAYYTCKRFVEGYSLLELFLTAQSLRRRQEIALVTELDIENNRVENIQLDCLYKEQCKVTGCRQKLIKMIEAELTSAAH